MEGKGDGEIERLRDESGCTPLSFPQSLLLSISLEKSGGAMEIIIIYQYRRRRVRRGGAGLGAVARRQSERTAEATEAAPDEAATNVEAATSPTDAAQPDAPIQPEPARPDSAAPKIAPAPQRPRTPNPERSAFDGLADFVAPRGRSGRRRRSRISPRRSPRGPRPVRSRR